MQNSSEPVVVYVTYVGTPQSRFDRHYYVTGHLPLVMQAWQQYGLLSVSAFFPAVDQAGTVAICECLFRDDAGLAAAFASVETADVMADIAHFTDLAPLRARTVAL